MALPPTNGYMFAVKLTSRPVNPGGTIAIMTPDASSPNLDTVNWQVAANGKVYVDPAVRVQFGADFINVTNNTGVAWPQHSEVVLCTPYLASPTSLEQAVAANTTNIATNATNIAINASNITDHETRIVTLEAAAP